MLLGSWAKANSEIDLSPVITQTVESNHGFVLNKELLVLITSPPWASVSHIAALSAPLSIQHNWKSMSKQRPDQLPDLLLTSAQCLLSTYTWHQAAPPNPETYPTLEQSVTWLCVWRCHISSQHCITVSCKMFAKCFLGGLFLLIKNVGIKLCGTNFHFASFSLDKRCLSRLCWCHSPHVTS